MNILVDIGHPAHVHFFRNAIGIWKQHGHRVLITAWEKSNVTELLNFYSFEYIMASRNRPGTLLPLLITFVGHTLKVVQVTKSFKPDVILSISSPMAAWAAALTGRPHVTFDDTEHAHIEHALYLPFTKIVYTPTSFKKDLGRKQRRYAGYHELAYLHPSLFAPNADSLKEAGLKPGETFFIVRLVSWKAAHDFGNRGFLPKETESLIEMLQDHGKVILSSESMDKTQVVGTPTVINPAKMHDLLAYATLYIGEGGTMATEAAILGTPAVFVSTLSAGNWIELENKYGLMFSVRHGAAAIAKIKELLALHNLKSLWAEKRQRVLEDKINVTKFMVDEIEKFYQGSLQ